MSESFRNAVLTPIASASGSVKSFVNRLCGDLEPWQIVVYTGGTTFAVLYLKDFLFHDDENLSDRAKRQFFKMVKKIPMVQKKIEEEMGKATSSIAESVNKNVEGEYLHRLPSSGLSSDKLLEELKRYKKMTNNSWKSGMVSGTVYNGDDSLTELMAKTYGMFAWANPLHPDVFPDVRKMEAEVVRMCCSMFNGDKDSCGAVTSGGTESIMLAMLAYRNIARDRGIKIPEIIVPVSAHAAFDKAANYFHMKITHIPLDEHTRKVDLNAMKKAIGRKTSVLVASAPQFPHGIIDPVEDVAKLGQQYGIPVHVDCCLGGFLLPFMDKAGFPIRPFDFRVPGVTSISADTHKYGFAPKGSSVIMYRTKALRLRQFFVQPNWTGGIYASPTFAGSRAGAIVAACWATMVHFGEEGYVDSTKRIISTTRYIASCLKSVNGIFVYGEPLVSVVGLGSKDFNIFRLFDALVEKNWNLNSLQFPSSLHLCVTLLHTQPGVADQFVQDVKDCVQEIMKNPSAECGGAGAIYGMAQSIPDRSLVNEIAGAFLEACYSTQPSHSVTNGVHALPNGDTKTK
ncbi:sphingosine-1-phosphate lyase 1 [Plakobranchus ocellatus]|uniref:sphinganine-1-phosphate aldolase n=1 Tax=Plakobranchus ocellatus TaxID=259542 RepID=A0AAV3YLC1_9GAST|nr:sphingosine-1-phosphate lyase 1 [Plakobranchus ocellatus]